VEISGNYRTPGSPRSGAGNQEFEQMPFGHCSTAALGIK